MESIHEVHLQCGSDVGIGDTVAHYTIHLQHTGVKELIQVKGKHLDIMSFDDQMLMKSRMVI